LNYIRKFTDQCIVIQCFLIFHLLDDGTDVVFESILLEHLSVDYDKKNELEFILCSSSYVSIVVIESYNSILVIHTMITILIASSWLAMKYSMIYVVVLLISNVRLT